MAMDGICKIPDCGNGGKLTRGWCDKHYQRWRKNGDPLVSKIDRENAGQPCKAEGCEKTSAARGYCQAHYRRLKLYGSAEAFHPDYHTAARWIAEHVGHQGDECLPWPYSRNGNGRGGACIDGVQMSAPRAMCIAAHGPPPTPEHETAHSCGRSHEGCMNPQHLRWATSEENKADMLEHGTLRRGTQINTAKLTEEDVRLIRQLSASDTRKALAERFEVTYACICDVVTRRSWAWLD
jgi:hypothetical protein